MRWLLPGLLLLFFVGCNSSRVPVTGRVIMDGKPLAHANVTFHRTDEDGQGGPYVASARTDAEGRFRLTTMAKDGVRPGSYRILIAKFAAVENEQMMPEDYAHFVASTTFEDTDPLEIPGPRLLVPSRYVTIQTTPLTRHVKVGARNDFPLVIE